MDGVVAASMRVLNEYSTEREGGGRREGGREGGVMDGFVFLTTRLLFGK
jgi:hypothetical protein